MNKPVIVAFAALTVAGLGAAAFQPGSETPAKPATPPPSSPVTAPPTAEKEIAQVAFLAGSWRGTLNGAVVEETWTNPAGNNVVGVFRWLKKEGTIMMSEILAITAEPDAVRLRFHHFDPVLSAGGKGDKPITMRLASAGPKRLEFAPEKDCGDLAKVVYSIDGDRLTVDVSFSGTGGAAMEPLQFKLTRIPLGAK